MEKVGVIIGFNHGYNYYRTADIDGISLPGIIIDIYAAYKRCIAMNINKILVITDIKEDAPTDIIIDLLRDGSVNLDIQTFIQDLKRRSQYYLYSDFEELIKKITHLFNSGSYIDRKVFFYYTGHIREGCIMLPFLREEITRILDKTPPQYLPLIKIRNIIQKNNGPESQIFILVDGCYPDNIGMPYCLEKVIDPEFDTSETIYRLSEPITKGIKLFKQKIIVITSSLPHQSSIVTEKGSPISQAIFSRFKYLSDLYHQIYQEDVYHINRLINIIGTGITYESLLKYLDLYMLKLRHYRKDSRDHIQTVKIYASYPNILSIWSWLINPNTIQCEFDLNKSFVKIIR